MNYTVLRWPRVRGEQLRNVFAIWCLSAGVVGCPMPLKQTTFPRVSGTILYGGEPIEGASILRGASEQCDSLLPLAISDSHGRFDIPEQREWVWVLVPMDPITTWNLCIESDRRLVLGWSNSQMGPPSHAVELVCDLASRINLPEGGVREAQFDRGGFGICQNPSIRRR
jgi:hypothetical protein